MPFVQKKRKERAVRGACESIDVTALGLEGKSPKTGCDTRRKLESIFVVKSADRSLNLPDFSYQINASSSPCRSHPSKAAWLAVRPYHSIDTSCEATTTA